MASWRTPDAKTSTEPSRFALTQPDKPSIAVLPFANLSGDPAQEYFADFNTRKTFGWVIDRDKEIAEARRLARRALQSYHDDASVLCFVGWTLAFLVGDADDGTAFLDQALLINPNLAWRWGASGWVKVWLGEPDKAVERFAYAMRLGPLDPLIFFMQLGTAYAHFFADRHNEAFRWAKMALREQPDNRRALSIAAATCALAGGDEEARRLMARLLEIDPTFRVSNFLLKGLGPYRQPEYLVKYADAPRNVGLPE